MMPIRRRTMAGWFAAAAVGCAVGAPVHAQTPDARVVAPGMLQFRVGGVFSLYDQRFGHPFRPTDTERERLTDELFEARLTELAFAPFDTLRTAMNTFFAAAPEPPDPLEPGSLEALTLRLQARADNRTVDFSVELGLVSRVSLRVRVPLVQHWLDVAGFEVADGNVGWNPDPTGNAALLEAVGTQFAGLGRNAFLPVAGSAVGEMLQARVMEATDGLQLALPTEPVGRLGLGGLEGADEIIGGRYSPRFPGWELGDATVGVSVQLARPAREGTVDARPQGLRAVVDAAARLPTGIVPTANYLVFPKPLLGLPGGSVGVRAEYTGGRLGAFVGARAEHLRPVTLQQAYRELVEPDPEEPPPALPAIPAIVREIEWEPGTRLEVMAMPFFHLVDEIRLAAGYAFQRRAETYRFADPGAGVVPDAAVAGTTSAHSWTAGVEFSTLDAYAAGRARIPFEALLFFRNAWAGAGGAPAARTVEMQARLFVRIWGGG